MLKIVGYPDRPDPMVRHVVDRCHVADRYSDVLRELVSTVRGKKRGWRAASRQQRRLATAMVVWQHNENLRLYWEVMRG